MDPNLRTFAEFLGLEENTPLSECLSHVQTVVSGFGPDNRDQAEMILRVLAVAEINMNKLEELFTYGHCNRCPECEL